MSCSEGACRYPSMCPAEGSCEDTEGGTRHGSVCTDSPAYPGLSCRFLCMVDADCEGREPGLAQCSEGVCLPNWCDPSEGMMACADRDDPTESCALTLWDGGL